MNKVFKQEWELYCQGGDRPVFRGVKPRTQGVFDGPIKVGEIRIFADINRPFVALVLSDGGKAGYRIVPVSPFTVPASARELLVGERVYQLWNACLASRSFVERSWVVDSLGEGDLADIAEALAAVPPGALSVDETAAAYERAFLVSGGNFRFPEPELARVAVGWWRRRTTWGIAAMLAVCCSIGVVVLHEERREDQMCCLGQSDEECDCELEAEPTASIDVIVDAPMRDGVELKPQIGCALRLEKPIVMKKMRGPRKAQAVWACERREDGFVRPLGEKYAEFVENPFENPKDTPLSTFGLDVDTASYVLMRSSLMDMRRRPPKDSVRIEEFVNYFAYNYAEPTGEHPVAVSCDLAACPWNGAHRLLRVGLQAKRIDEAKLPPCNLTFLVDVSGSMEGEDRLGLLKKALKLLVGKLREEDHVAVVTYADGTRVALPSVSGREKKAIGEVIDGLQAGGCTAGGAGLQLAYREAKKNFEKKANNRVILVTDGDFNVGISSPRELEGFIKGKRESGIFLTVLGVGRGNYRDANMKKLANAGNGNYAFLDSLAEAKKVLLKEFGGTMMTVAKDVKLQLEFNPAEVEGYRLLGYENRKLAAKDFADDQKDAGEMGSGHTMTAFYEIVPAGGAEKVRDGGSLKYQQRVSAGKGEFCTVKLRYKRPDGDKSVLVEKAHKTADILRKEPDQEFRFASAVVEFALVLKNSQYKENASLTNAIERARGAKGEDREGYRAEFIRLIERSEEVEKKPTQPPAIEVEVDI